MTILSPKPVIETCDGFNILRDDLLAGGTKQRAIHAVFSGADEYVYAGPCQGYAQVALAIGCREFGKRATLFIAERATVHHRTALSVDHGAKVVGIRPGYLSVVCKSE